MSKQRGSGRRRAPIPPIWKGAAAGAFNNYLTPSIPTSIPLDYVTRLSCIYTSLTDAMSASTSDRSTLLRNVLSNLQSLNVTLLELLSFVVVHTQFNRPNDILFKDLVANTRVILAALYHNPATASSSLAWAQDITRAHHSDTVSQLTSVSHGWHFGATQADPTQIQDFQLDDMADHLEKSAPDLWALVIGLLGRRTEAVRARPAAQSERRALFWDDPEDDEYWDGDDDVGDSGQPSSRPANDVDKRGRRRSLLSRVVSLHAALLL